jgi:hypothetical protein
MPFKSKKQMSYLKRTKPSVYKKFVKDSGGKVKYTRKKKKTGKKKR